MLFVVIFNPLVYIVFVILSHYECLMKYLALNVISNGTCDGIFQIAGVVYDQFCFSLCTV